MARYPFDDSLAPGPVEGLLSHAHARAWDPFRDLDWHVVVDWRELELPDRSSLVSHFDVFPRLSRADRQAAKCLEMASHLSSLADGEQRAAELAAATSLLDPPTQAHLWFLSTLMADEAKHYAVLVHYLHEKVRMSFTPAPALSVVFAELRAAASFELNTIAGQLVLEATASALLAALLTAVREPLLHSLLRKIMRDEARHMTFARSLSFDGDSPRDRQLLTRRQARDLLFEAAYAGAASLLALEAWEHVGIPPRQSRPQAVETLKAKGVLDFYRRVVIEQLARQGYRTDTLAQQLEKGLEQRLRGPP